MPLLAQEDPSNEVILLIATLYVVIIFIQLPTNSITALYSNQIGPVSVPPLGGLGKRTVGAAKHEGGEGAAAESTVPPGGTVLPGGTVPPGGTVLVPAPDLWLPHSPLLTAGGELASMLASLDFRARCCGLRRSPGIGCCEGMGMGLDTAAERAALPGEGGPGPWAALPGEGGAPSPSRSDGNEHDLRKNCGMRGCNRSPSLRG